MNNQVTDLQDPQDLTGREGAKCYKRSQKTGLVGPTQGADRANPQCLSGTPCRSSFRLPSGHAWPPQRHEISPRHCARTDRRRVRSPEGSDQSLGREMGTRRGGRIRVLIHSFVPVFSSDNINWEKGLPPPPRARAG